jgi:hypothetical protein
VTTTAFTNNVTLTDAAWFNDADTVVYGYLTGVAGTNTITATGPTSLSAYAAGQRFWFIPANDNTGATTIAITGATALSAKNIFCGGAACAGGEIQQNVPCLIIYDGTQFNIVGPFSGGAVPGNIAGAGSIKSSHATGGIGYATGAGGTVAQDTSKSTLVALNKATGRITMHDATLDAATTVVFPFTNTSIAATDLLVLNHVSGGTAGAYALNAQASAGAADISVRNITAGNLNEAVVIGYAVVKAVTS